MENVHVLVESVLSLKPTGFAHPKHHSRVFVFHCSVFLSPPLLHPRRCPHTCTRMEQTQWSRRVPKVWDAELYLSVDEPLAKPKNREAASRIAIACVRQRL